MPLSTTAFDSIIIIKLIKMARNDYNFGMEDVAEDVQSPQEKVASSVENKIIAMLTIAMSANAWKAILRF